MRKSKLHRQFRSQFIMIGGNKDYYCHHGWDTQADYWFLCF